MGIANRDLEVSQQMVIFEQKPGLVGVSALIYCGQVPFTGQVMRVVSSAYGLSGAPILGLQIQRFIAGVGNTVIPLNGSSLLTVTAYSTSGMQTHALSLPGSTLVQVLSGDQLQVVTSVANTAATYQVSWVIQNLQDFSSQYGLGLGS